MIDEIDYKILRILLKNSRSTYVDIAREVNLSDVAVIKRIKKLENIGVIKKYSCVIDPVKLGYSKVSITGINVDPDALLNVIENLKNKDYVKYIAITSGDHELITIIWARDSDELMRIHREIESLPGVRKIYPALLLDVVKDDVSFF
uniref:Lrp/AsnC family transcriptional regulator n=1 Tax=Staphylothermus marinus TaxID=2280 RepID=A0A7C4H646_STAMA